MRVHSFHSSQRRIFHLATSTLLGTALLHIPTQAQPTPDPALRREEAYSLAELERFINGRTLVTIDLKEATLKEVVVALAKNTGLTFVEAYRTPPLGHQTLTVELGVPNVVQVPAPTPGSTRSNPNGAPKPGKNLADRLAALENRAVPPPRLTAGAPEAGAVLEAPPETLYSVSSRELPFWEAMRQWHLEAQHANEQVKKEARARAFKEKKPYSPSEYAPSSFNVRIFNGGLELNQGITLGDGYVVSNWPVLLQGKNIQRSQRAELTEAGAAKAETPVRFVRPGQSKTVPTSATDPEELMTEEKRWTDSLNMDVNVFFEPKMAPSRVRYEILEAVDDKGNDLRSPVVSPRPAFQSNDSWPLQILLASKPGMGKKLTKLRGVIRFNVLTRTQHWETTDLEKPVEDTLRLEGGNFKIAFSGLRKEGEQWTGSFNATSRGKHLEHFWNNRFANGGNPGSGVLDFTGTPFMRLVDANGNTIGGRERMSSMGIGLRPLKVQEPGTPLPHLSVDLSPVPPDVTENWEYEEARAFDFARYRQVDGNLSPALGEGVKLVVDFPIERREISVPFEFTNLPLPPS